PDVQATANAALVGAEQAVGHRHPEALVGAFTGPEIDPAPLACGPVAGECAAGYLQRRHPVTVQEQLHLEVDGTAGATARGFVVAEHAVGDTDLGGPGIPDADGSTEARDVSLEQRRVEIDRSVSPGER